jgi:hypothetical protein
VQRTIDPPTHATRALLVLFEFFARQVGMFIGPASVVGKHFFAFTRFRVEPRSLLPAASRFPRTPMCTVTPAQPVSNVMN